MLRQDGYFTLPSTFPITAVMLIIPILLLTAWPQVTHIMRIEIDPLSQTAPVSAANDLVVKITPSHEVLFDERLVSLRQLYAGLLQEHARLPARRLFVSVHPKVSHNQFMQVLVVVKRSALPISGITADKIAFEMPSDD